ncbi:uncharacterized protein MKZ38_006011 [Zalerion maritima]|uniref:Ras modification protein ERF4 n=1 Tax=Zalerion maritima TaxID=339359 RepID=A0AAD5RJF1_9PEZI|nr:uncharacterized protein MKZ38_006011 [Zalerion maritima]
MLGLRCFAKLRLALSTSPLLSASQDILQQERSDPADQERCSCFWAIATTAADPKNSNRHCSSTSHRQPPPHWLHAQEFSAIEPSTARTNRRRSRQPPSKSRINRSVPSSSRQLDRNCHRRSFPSHVRSLNLRPALRYPSKFRGSHGKLPRTRISRGRSDGRSLATASHAQKPTQSQSDPSAVISSSYEDTEDNPRIPSISNQPAYPGARSIPTPPPAATLRSGRRAHEPTAQAATSAAAAAAARLHPQQPSDSRFPRPQAYFLQSPFRKGPVPSSSQPRRSGPRLWNPTNSTPRGSNKTTPTASHKTKNSNATATTAASAAKPERARHRRPSTPPPPSVPLQHPSLDISRKNPGDTSEPLLSLPEQRQTKLPPSARASLQLDRDSKRISLPRSVRHSYDSKGATTPASASFPAEVLRELREIEQRQQEPSAGEEVEVIAGPSKPPLSQPLPAVKTSPSKSVTGFRKRGQSISNKFAEASSTFGLRLDRKTSAKSIKGKGKMPAVTLETPAEGANAPDTFSPDLERGPDYPDQNRISEVSGIGPALTDSDSSSIMGDPNQADAGIDEWGPSHPCYPHLNPHVPVGSPEFVSTRIIRIKRDWLVKGDLAPTFSNLYPEILDPAGVPEQEFRRVIEKLNKELVPIFSPYGWRNVMDGVMGLVTGWLWDDFGFSAVKGRLGKLEKWVQVWNEEMKRQVGGDANSVPQIMPLRRTGYMTLDIQIPDPEIAPAPSTPARSGYDQGHIEPVQEPAPAITVS